MTKKFLILFIVLFPFFLYAETFQVLNQNEDELIVKFSLPEFELQNIKSNHVLTMFLSVVNTSIS